VGPTRHPPQQAVRERPHGGAGAVVLQVQRESAQPQDAVAEHVDLDPERDERLQTVLIEREVAQAVDHRHPGVQAEALRDVRVAADDEGGAGLGHGVHAPEREGVRPLGVLAAQVQEGDGDLSGLERVTERGGDRRVVGEVRGPAPLLVGVEAHAVLGAGDRGGAEDRVRRAPEGDPRRRPGLVGVAAHTGVGHPRRREVLEGVLHPPLQVVVLVVVAQGDEAGAQCVEERQRAGEGVEDVAFRRIRMGGVRPIGDRRLEVQRDEVRAIGEGSDPAGDRSGAGLGIAGQDERVRVVRRQLVERRELLGIHEPTTEADVAEEEQPDPAVVGFEGPGRRGDLRHRDRLDEMHGVVLLQEPGRPHVDEHVASWEALGPERAGRVGADEGSARLHLGVGHRSPCGVQHGPGEVDPGAVVLRARSHLGGVGSLRPRLLSAAHQQPSGSGNGNGNQERAPGVEGRQESTLGRFGATDPAASLRRRPETPRPWLDPPAHDSSRTRRASPRCSQDPRTSLDAPPSDLGDIPFARYPPRSREAPMRALVQALLLSILLLALSGCSLKQVALNSVADMLSSPTGGSFSQDDDLQFVGEALPFALKLMEAINDGTPKHVAMKLTLASGFTQYGVVFVEWPATQAKYDDFDAYEHGRTRARGFYLRANGYAMDGLDLLHPGFRSRIMTDTDALLAEMTADDVPLLFWLGASWVSAATTNLEDPEMFGLLPIGAGILQRCFALDPDWDDGAIREVMISLEPALPGPGGEARAREHYDRVIAIKGDTAAGPHVALATAVAQKAQDKEEFVRLLNLALDVDLEADEEHRLANDYAQQKARFLLDHLDDLFY
jgi:hypothetical protein